MFRENQRKEEKKINGEKFKIAIVAAEFNGDIVGRMQDSALETLQKNGVKEANIQLIKVPGAFEIPLTCQKLAQKNSLDAIIILGCVIKGGTDHYYYIAGESSRGVMEVMLKFSIPIGFGIITTDNLEQAIERSSGKSNKGREAAEAVLKMLDIKY